MIDISNEAKNKWLAELHSNNYVHFLEGEPEGARQFFLWSTVPKYIPQNSKIYFVSPLGQQSVKIKFLLTILNHVKSDPFH